MARVHGDTSFVPLLLFPFRSTVLVRVFDIFRSEIFTLLLRVNQSF